MRVLVETDCWFMLSGPQWASAALAPARQKPPSNHKRGARDPSLRHGRVLSFTSLAILGGFYK